MWAFIQAHSAVLAGVAVAVIDAVIALVPSINGNGLVHWVLVQLQIVAAPPSS